MSCAPSHSPGAATGRPWTARGPVLKLVAPLTGKLVWRLEDDTRLHVRLEADRPGLALISALPPWYLDPDTGECGPLETGFGEREAGLLAMALALTPQSAEALHETAPLREFTLPLLPSRTERRLVASESPIPCLHLRSRDLNARASWAVIGASNRSPIGPTAFGYGRPVRGRGSPG